jgi:cystathionine beta-lyase family protein involved in aluminum resistance
MLENILPKDYLDYTTHGLQFIVDSVKGGVKIPVVCFLNKTTREFVNDLERLEIGVNIMRP